VWYLFVILVVISGDQLTKILVVKNFALFDSVEIIPGFFNLTFLTNRGAAFSILADIDSPWRHYFFLIVGGCALLILSIWLFQTRNESQLQSYGIALICGGTCGNLIDRIRIGEVVDFLDFYYRSYHWPAFNIADMAICSGVVIVIFSIFFVSEKEH